MKRIHWVTLIFFGIIYSLVSLVNHYNFRSFAFDLGLETNAAYDYAHFRVSDAPLMDPPYENYLSDHFSVDLIFISPVIYIFGTYGLLIAQIAALLLGGIGIFKYVKQRSGDVYLANLALIHFYGFWGIFSALQFDYHNNVLGAMVVPWIFYFIESRKIRPAIISFALLLLSKENMAFWAFFVTSGMIFTYRKDKQIRNLLILMSGISLVYFFMVVNVIIPALANAGRAYNHLNYRALGNNFGEIISKIIHTPHVVIDLLFKTKETDPLIKDIKMELHMFVLLSGGFALIYRPQYLWMLLPIYAQKLFHDDPVKWGVNVHYNIEFAPILTIAVYDFINSYLQKKIPRRVVMTLATILGLITSYSLMNKNHSLYYDFKNVQFFKKYHYESDFDVKEVYQAIKLIPSDAKVSANQSLVSHLCLRQYVFVYPVVRDADYIAILMNGYYYPMEPSQMQEKFAALQIDNEWEKVYDKTPLTIFKRKAK